MSKKIEHIVANGIETKRCTIVRREGKEFSSLQKREVKRRDKMICQLCGVTTTDKTKNKTSDSCHIDHIIPISDNGTNYLINGRVLCKKCNQSQAKIIHREVA